ncbi:MAG TPA: carboxypeptidase-like regulatory domain-containing protein [Blastocatellia bacterium]|nr:carboxypeptidase-like regulatory domain-containing protein [Blastocatellia bacterium]
MALGLILLSIYAALYVPPAAAQLVYGTVTGQVVSSAGATPLPNAKVTITNEDDGKVRATLTDGSGFYRVTYLPPGQYKIVAALDGYHDANVSAIIPLGEISYMRLPNITLYPANVSQPAPAIAPTVSPETPVSTSDSKRRGNYNDEFLLALPLGGTTDMRTFDELAFLTAGVAPPPYTPGVKGPGIGFGVGTSGQFAVNGMRSRSNNFSIDGSDNNDPDVGVRRQGFVALLPQSVESIKEFQIATLLWDAEIGRNVGSQVNAVSRDGGNRFHGQVYGYVTDARLNARNTFDLTGDQDPLTRTQAGFVIGGPIVKDRTQFFGSFEALEVHQSIEEHFATPRLAERRFFDLPQFRVLKPGPGFDLSTFFQTDLGATPLGRNLLSFYPDANNSAGPFAANTYTELLPASGDGTIFSGKLTHQVNARNSLAGRYNFTNDMRLLPSVNQAIRSTVESHTKTQDLSIIFDTQLQARLFNQARFSYGRTRLRIAPVADSPFTFSKQSTEQIGVPGGETQPVISRTQAIGELQISRFSPVGVNATTFKQERTNNTFQYADSMSWSVGDHAMKFGADIRRLQLNSLLERNYRPQVVFSDGLLTLGTLNPAPPPTFFAFTPGAGPVFLSGLELAALGLPSSIFQTITAGPPDSTTGLRLTEYNFFFNDNWRVRRNLTIDYGVRYEYNSVPREVNRRIESAIGLENLPAPGGSLADAPERTSAFNAAVAAYREVLGGRTRIFEPDRNNFGPHIGFAWSPGSTGRMSIRGGYGIYYDAILGAVVTQSRNVFPNEIPLNIDPAFTQFDVFVLNNPSTLVIRDGAKGAIPDIPLIKPGTLNQFGGGSADFVALIGALFAQNAGGGGLAFTLPEKNLRTPYAQHWHLTLERELFGDATVSLAYVGTKGTKLTRLTTPNLGPNVLPQLQIAALINLPGVGQVPTVLAECARYQPNGKCEIAPPRPQPALGAYQIFADSANSTYHALQVEGRKRLSRGFAFTASYTWSHALDDVSDVFPIAGAPILPQDSFDLRRERASANFDIRHRFAASFIWDLPIFKDGQGAAHRLLGGWQLSSLFQAQGGQPFTVNLPIDANIDGNLTDRPSTTDGLVTVGGHHAQRLAMAEGSAVTDFFVLGRNGFVGRNTFRGDKFIDLDMALRKLFHFSERQALEFRAESFNLLNRANYGLPVRVLGSPGFGSAAETVNPARTIQFALKYSF